MSPPASFSGEGEGSGSERKRDQLARVRRRMLRDDIHARGVRDSAVLSAMDRVERHRFVAVAAPEDAYEDRPLPIGFGQTISQPYVVALMSQLLAVRPGERILEIGAGCGYQTAVLLEMGAFVFAIEVIPELAAGTEGRLREMGYQGFEVSCHDGHRGWTAHAPYDGAILAAAADELPRAVLNQVGPEGRIVAPIGRDADSQNLEVWRRAERGWVRERVCPVRFVPLVRSDRRE